ncbi:hypothetical protein LWI29_023289 [Acer saccharum]|uniref:Uncharacterized protein n=1 Tax=Acer saccharum TaxID=4024 RepID=A0AA39W2Z9_ACESA|nr:hypothetical protein LWI29_023289 [Acer saccharum]
MGSRRSPLEMIADPILICLFFDSEFPTNPGLLEYDEISNLANLSLHRTQIRRLVRLEIWVSGDSEGWVFQRK